VQAAGVRLRVLGEQRLDDVDALLAQHRVGDGAHAVLDLLGREDAVALRGVVDAVARVRDPAERALVVLGLEAEVTLEATTCTSSRASSASTSCAGCSA
jgi:hypothetical protein